MPLPTEKEEVWRYTPIDRLSLDDYAPVAAGDGDGDGREPDGTGAAFVDGVAADLGGAAAVLASVDGTVRPALWGSVPAGVRAGGLEVLDGEEDVVGALLTGGDALVRLNDAFHPGVVVVDVGPGVRVDAPIVVVHWCAGAASASAGDGPAPASFPRTLVRLAPGAEASVVEVLGGAPGGHPALVAPVAELAVADGARLAYLSVQVLGTGAWHIGRLSAGVGRDATLRTFTVGLGGAYDRLRADATASGPGATTELRSAYLGTGEQVHDIRTLQDHAAPHTTSDLLCMGAVAGRSRSVYSGLIRVRRGAVRAQAFQTNHNLVLDARAHADSVPNLDIEENDVRCSHASTVGPIDEDQRYYVESRGVPPERAERLIVLGFFDDIVSRCPVPGALGRLRREIGLRLAEAVGTDPAEAAPEAVDG